MLAKKTSKNQVTLPKKIIDALPATVYFDVSLREGAVILRPVTITESGNRLAAVRRKIRALGLTSKDIDDAIRWSVTGGKGSPRMKTSKRAKLNAAGWAVGSVQDFLGPQQTDDVLDLEAFEKRAKERCRPFEKVLADLKRNGLL